MPYNFNVFICCYTCENMYQKVKVELKLSFICHEYTEDVKASLHSVLMFTLDGGEWSRLRSGCFIPMKEATYLLSRMLGGPQSVWTCWEMWKFPALTVFEVWSVQPMSYSLYLLWYPGPYQKVLLYNKLFLPVWNIFMTFGADSYTHITLKTSSKFCLPKLPHEFKVKFLMIVILHIFCCHVIQDTAFTVGNWCLCLHSTEVQ
jgi:hypothetical protein